MTKLYHRDVFVPQAIVSSVVWVGRQLRYSNHAIEEAGRDYVSILPGRVPVDAQLIELETIDGSISKFVLRWKLDTYRDLIAVVLPNGFVKTVWTNDRTDSHRSLNRSRYAVA